jgi:hypothetical protein
LYQYISLCVLLPEGTISVMFPLLRAPKHLLEVVCVLSSV